MKKASFLLLLTFALAAGVLSGCGAETQENPMTPEERTQLYRTAIESARDQDTNDAYGIVTSPEDDLAEIVFEMLGVEEGDMSAYALSVSPMNVKAYAVAAIYPAAGKEDAVQEGLDAFVENRKASFEQYLMDQYDIADSARLETLDDGTVLLVMCPDQDAVFDAIRTSIEAG